ncbi:hypothetical protein [Spirosoma gilvum]
MFGWADFVDALLMNFQMFIRSTRFCFTRPVSSTGSMWTGYGGWHHRVCTFLLVQNPDKHKHILRRACQFIRPGDDYLSQRIHSTPSIAFGRG